MPKITTKYFIDLHNYSTEKLLDELSKIVSGFSVNKDKPIIYETIGLILIAHSGDTRRKPDLCIDHILRVAIITCNLFGYNANLLLLALLHDIVEDYPEFLPVNNQKQIWLYIDKKYGKRVSKTLHLLTNQKEVEQEERNKGSEHIKYHGHLNSVFENEDAFVIKLADYIDNITTVSISPNQKLRMECIPRYLPLMPKYEKRLLLLEKYKVSSNFNLINFFKMILNSFT